MGRLLLQMMISVDGMVSGPKGELDWLTDWLDDESLNQYHLKMLKQSNLILLGAGGGPGMIKYWDDAQHDKKMSPLMHEMARAMTETPKVIYSHQRRQVEGKNTDVHVVADDDAFIRDVKRTKQETDGPIITYGGVRLAHSFLQHGLLDEILLNVCPIVVGNGQPLFTNEAPKIKLHLRDSTTYKTGATMAHYEMAQAA